MGAHVEVMDLVARGGATFRLTPESPDAALLTYEVDAQIGGKLAQLGGRLIDSRASKLAGQFSVTFQRRFDDSP